MSIHKAIIARIRISDHPDPTVHSLAVGTVCHETVICGKDIPDGTLGVYFPCELQLSEEFAATNDLVRRKDIDGKPAGGMFDANRRVRVQKFKGIKSVGFWTSLEALEKLGGSTASLKEGDLIDSWNGKPVCNKYITPQTQRSLNLNKVKSKLKTRCVFPEHEDTKQFKHHVNNIKSGDNVVITLKLEGTSQRIARNLEFRNPNFIERLVGKFFKLDLSRMINLNGTRRVTLNYKKSQESGYYPDTFREAVFNKIAPYLEEYMEIFIEVVGWSESGKTIMPTHNLSKLQDKEIKKQYKDPIIFSYECKPNTFDFYVYRIAYVLPNSKTVDLCWGDVKKWCSKNNIKHAPELASFVFDGNHKDLIDLVESLSDGPDPLNLNHPREGVCIRVDSTNWECYKNKGYSYKILNDIIKSSESYQDIEEVS